MNYMAVNNSVKQQEIQRSVCVKLLGLLNKWFVLDDLTSETFLATIHMVILRNTRPFHRPVYRIFTNIRRT